MFSFLTNLFNCQVVDEMNRELKTWRRFQDGERPVDFVLAYPGDDKNPQNMKKRIIFEKNLEAEGLQIEREQTQKIHFIKLHAPQNVLCTYCAILKIKMPIKVMAGQENIIEDEFHLMQEVKSFFGRPFEFIKLDTVLFPEKKYQLTYEFSKEKSYLFDEESPNFFPTSTRIQIVNFILERAKFSDDENNVNVIGINKLLSDNTYSAAYPLHDGDANISGNERSLLYKEWGSVSKWIKHQPLDNIKEYFGAHVALYFAWLGFYTHMLIPAAIVGLICFIYGIITLWSNQYSKDICSESNDILMCPQCDRKCDFWKLQGTCVYSQISYLFDNNLTVFFAFVMSFWSTLYLELWKRYSANIMHRWGLTGYCHQAEHPRPEYLAKLDKYEKKENYITGVLEPNVPFWRFKFTRFLISFSVIFLFILTALAAVFAIIIYRMSLNTSRNFYGNTDSMSYKVMVLPATAAVINLVVITILNFIYNYLAIYLTDIELRRTQQEYDESLSLKIYLFQFVNYYSSIFYIAFLKGKFVGYPAKYNRVFKLRQEECSPGGCLMELCIQLVIIMVGKQALNAAMEMLIPLIMKTWNQISNKIGLSKEGENGETLICCSQWTEDYKLLDWPARGLFEEYLEMIIQYGFITIFVVAFPLAPLFALINNIFEMRLDAKKMLRFYKRSVPHRIKDIGIWYGIMNILGKISVWSSAFIIAFSTNFIPRLVYMATVGHGSDYGFLNYTLAYFNTSDFQEGTAPGNSSYENVEICRYAEFRNPPNVVSPLVKYKRPLDYWHILAIRLAFIVVYQNVVGMVQMMVELAIPDVPRSLKDKMKREEYLTRENIIEQEKVNIIKKCDDEDEMEEEEQRKSNGGNGVTHRKKTNETNF